MRTTIELSDAHRAMLLRLAAERGHKGFSILVAEAVEAYLANLGVTSERASAARLKGILSEADAKELEDRVKAARERWR
ncbi:MAG TPA: hypothetical protein VFM88_19105 [Vicinamibacteria bacterium]|nr:hypothetical protein [Vicinamibacteria bacterium]